MTKTYEMKEHAQLVKSILRKRFKADICISGNVKVSAKYQGFKLRSCTKQEVFDVIYNEELPIDVSQLIESTATIHHELYGIIKVDAVVIRL